MESGFTRVPLNPLTPGANRQAWEELSGNSICSDYLPIKMSAGSV